MTASTTILAPTTETTFFGATISATIVTPGHSWVADSSGLFQTTTNLATEWQGFYDQMQAGQASSLTFIQRLEGNAQAVFLNTGLNNLSADVQQRDREDVQREFDAMGSAFVQLGLANDKAALTTQQYLQVTQTIESNASLYELAMQGHGLNNPSDPKYNGYTNDFQNNVDGTTLYIGGGLDNNQNALTDFFDDVIISHVLFPSVYENGTLVQLNQNGANEDKLTNAVGAFDAAGTSMVLKASDFSATAGTASNTLATPPASNTVVPAGDSLSLFGFAIPTTQTLNGHTWTENSAGLYVTTSDLATEWKGYYKLMLAGQGGSLNSLQWIEGNAEAVFENTGLAGVVANNPNQAKLDREDLQREIDAIDGAMLLAGISLTAPMTQANYLLLEHTLQGNAALEELAIQGHGLNSPPSVVYRGYTNDFQNNVDQKTLYVGPGFDTGERAIADLFDDAIMTHVPFPTVAQNGEIDQLNQNGADESTVQSAIDGWNQFHFNTVLTAASFNIPGNTPYGVTDPAGTVTTLWGDTIASTMVAGAHTWTVGADGKFHTTTDLMTEWQGYYKIMLAGNGASLTAIQRLEGNAESVFENTGLSNLTKFGFDKQQSFREDAQREFDAISVAMTKLHLGSALLSAQDYLNIDATIRSSASLEELAVQGHGLNSPPSAKYNGYTNDFQNNSDNTTQYVGGGLDNGQKAITDFFDDVIMSHLLFPVVSQNGALEQLNQNAAREDTLTDVVKATNSAMFTRVFVASDFSANAAATGAVVNVTYSTPLTTDASPVAGAGQMLSLTGQPVPTTMVANGDTWVADSAGRYSTTTDLTLEWWNSYQAALAGKTLTLTQKWQAQAEAVFLNTGLNNVSEGQQERDREDAQMEMDAVITEMNALGLGSKALTTADYRALGTALQNNAALEQLAVEGHGLNNPYVAGVTEYLGYTNDFQHNVDNRTLFVGPGADDGERAIADFFDDAIMTHLPFAVAAQNGELIQLNQNGNNESTLTAAVGLMNNTLFGSLLTSANFYRPGAQTVTVTSTVPTTITGAFGETLPGTVTLNGHTWTADSTSTYQTTANLEMEWRSDYQTMLAGNGNTLTATQRLEGNAEAFFENSNINTMWNGAAKEEQMRVDIQREIDAIAGAQAIDQTTYGYSTTAEFTVASYIQLGNTIRGNDQLEELALQGHGLANAPSVQYRGAYNDIFAGADWSTYFVGGGVDNGKLGIAYVLGDMISNSQFDTTYVNGAWIQTGTNGSTSMTALNAASLMNQAMYRQVFTHDDFSKTATDTGSVKLIPGAQSATVTPISAVTAPTGDIVTLSGAVIANKMTVNGHVWTAGADGLFHTANLAAEWQSDYATMQAGNGGTLNAIQRAEGNAEAVLEATGISKLTTAQQQAIREDVQRQFDAEACAIKIDNGSLGLANAPVLIDSSYVEMSRTIQTHNALEELALQGHGVTGSGSARYNGVLVDAKLLNGTKYVGGGLNNGNYAAGAFLQQNIMGDAPFGIVRQNGVIKQLDQNGNAVLSVADQVAALDDTFWYRTYTKTSFK